MRGLQLLQDSREESESRLMVQRMTWYCFQESYEGIDLRRSTLETLSKTLFTFVDRGYDSDKQKFRLFEQYQLCTKLDAEYRGAENEKDSRCISLWISTRSNRNLQWKKPTKHLRRKWKGIKMQESELLMKVNEIGEHTSSNKMALAVGTSVLIAYFVVNLKLIFDCCLEQNYTF